MYEVYFISYDGDWCLERSFASYEEAEAYVDEAEAEMPLSPDEGYAILLEGEDVVGWD